MKNQKKVPILIAFCVAVFFMMAAVLFLPSFDSSKLNGKVYPFNDGWYRVLDDGSRVPFEDFGKNLDTNRVVLEHDMEKITGTINSIGFYTYYSAVSVSIDNSLIFRYGTVDDIESGVLLGNYYAMVNVFRGPNAGHVLRLIFDSKDPVTVYNITIGSGSALEMDMIREYLSTLILPIVTLLFLLVIIILKNKKSTKDLVTDVHLWLVAFSSNMSIWILADSQLLMDIGLRAGSVCLLSFESYMLLPVTLMMLLYHICEEHKKADLTMSIIALVTFLGLNIFFLLGIASFIKMLPAIHICVASVLVIGLVQVVDEYRLHPAKYSLYLLIGYVSLALCASLQFFSFLANPTESNSKFLQVGALIFIILQIINVIKLVNDRIRQINTKLEVKSKLLEKTFGSFVPVQMIKSLIDDPERFKFSGDTRQLTVLQSDIRGFSDIINMMSATDAIEMLNHYLEAMTTIILRHEGTILEFVGDGIVATFDSKVCGDKHADKAIFTAVEMQNCMESIKEWNKEHGFPEFEMGIGINSGNAYVGYIGSQERLKYDAIGSTINLVSRIESYSTGGQILISETCKNLTTIDLIISNEYRVIPKGFYDEMTLYLIGGIGNPYNIICNPQNEVPILLDEPVTISFNTVKNKHCGSSKYDGQVIAVSETGITLQTTCPLMLFDNLIIISNGHIPCKVISKSKNGFLIRFTAVPKGYDGWGALKAQRGESKHE